MRSAARTAAWQLRRAASGKGAARAPSLGSVPHEAPVDAAGYPQHVAYPHNNYTYLVEPSAYTPDLEQEQQVSSHACVCCGVRPSEAAPLAGISLTAPLTSPPISPPVHSLPPLSPPSLRLKKVHSPEPMYLRVNTGYKTFHMTEPLQLTIRDNPAAGAPQTARPLQTIPT